MTAGDFLRVWDPRELHEIIYHQQNALDLHKAELGRLRAMVCECGHPEFFAADLHDDECPVRGGQHT